MPDDSHQDRFLHIGTFWIRLDVIEGVSIRKGCDGETYSLLIFTSSDYPWAVDNLTEAEASERAEVVMQEVSNFCNKVDN